jgi:protein involved in polysaccharide export with SLBB domain
MIRYYRITAMLVMAVLFASIANAQSGNSSDFSAAEDGDLFAEYEDDGELGYGKQLPLNSLNRTSRNVVLSLINSEPYFPKSGDIFLLKVFSQNRNGQTISFESQITVGRDNSIEVPYIGKVDTTGTDYLTLTRDIEKKIKEITYSELVSFEFLDPAQFEVFIGGAVRKPGLVIGNSFMRISDAISIAGGITNRASYRNIEVRKASGEKRSIDISKYSEAGDDIYNPYLEVGDHIVIPNAQMIVRLSGLSPSPGRYEVLERETLQDLLITSGGILEEADRTKVKVRRIMPDGSYTFFNQELDTANKFQLRDGDQIQIVSKVINSDLVTVTGAFFGKKRDGISAIASIPEEPIQVYYPYYPGMTVSEIVERLGGYTPYADTEKCAVYRNNEGGKINFNIRNLMSGEEEDIFLLPNDEVLVPVRSIRVEIRGEVVSPGEYSLLTRLSVHDLINKAGGFLPSAAKGTIEIDRKLQNGGYTLLMVDYESQEHTALHSGDTIVVKSGSVNSPLISVEGALIGKPFDGLSPVELPFFNGNQDITGRNGYSSEIIPSTIQRFLPFFSGMSLYYVLERLGGPTPFAIANASKISRDDETIEFDVFDMWENPDKARGMLLIPDDHIYIPMQPQTVTLLGEVIDPGILAFSREYSLAEYVLISGGIAKNGSKSKIFLVDVSGDIVKWVSLDYHPAPGDIFLFDTKLWIQIKEVIDIVIPLTTSIIGLTNLILALISSS